jgi:hypothetical protein
VEQKARSWSKRKQLRVERSVIARQSQEANNLDSLITLRSTLPLIPSSVRGETRKMGIVWRCQQIRQSSPVLSYEIVLLRTLLLSEVSEQQGGGESDLQSVPKH